MLDRIYSIAVETITQNGSICLHSNDELVRRYEFSESESLSKIFPKQILAILVESSLTLEDIRFLSVANGPGSFTNIRVAISALLGFARAASIPLIGVSFRELNERLKYPESDSICILAGKTQIVFGSFNSGIETINLEKLKVKIVNEKDTIFRADRGLYLMLLDEFGQIPQNVLLLDDISSAIAEIGFERFFEGNFTRAIPDYLEYRNDS